MAMALIKAVPAISGNRTKTTTRSHLICPDSRLRAPLKTKQKFGNWHSLKKSDCFENERQKNSDSGCNGNQRTCDHEYLDRMFEGFGRPPVPGDFEGRVANRLSSIG